LGKGAVTKLDTIRKAAPAGEGELSHSIFLYAHPSLIEGLGNLRGRRESLKTTFEYL